ncbi:MULTISPECIES: peptidylprolyl isomerase [unclassified Methylocaldum]|jgi:peptidyl-prolyl cis-trans isomerase C|uniref:peptidylprolyl isomerase n=1 Tax=unclassified Methylocaldum TaxID=2622260 RepID=UPI00098A0AD5|nr:MULTISPECIES: peptidylprolyl isomerase [unclassified Methylocaldum]MBP1152130.1 peptidyl-prolyl cis-trans isomerase C [Methylocaldum sp. RMAD-M]MDV3241992.1 peptidylprolyl isomerase [Methylocaldum sp.]
MKTYSLVAAIASVLVIAGCNNVGTDGQKGATSTTEAPTAENSVAVVNGRPISRAAVDILSAELAQRRGDNGISEEKIIDELIKRELLRQEAEAQQLTNDPKYAARVENADRMVLSQIAAEHFINSAAISDEDLKKEYDQRVGSMKLTEYKARHILVDTEQAAKDVIKRLQKGEKFADIAKKVSKDPGSKGSGGDLGWFNPQQMVPPFANAVVALKNGELTQTPVQTQFGWHVILREDSRDQPPPPFDAVKDQLRSMMQTQRLQQHIGELKNKAKIEQFEKPKPAEKPAIDSPQQPGAGTAPEKPSESPAADPSQQQPEGGPQEDPAESQEPAE